MCMKKHTYTVNVRVFDDFTMSIIYNRNKTGPEILPCVTADFISSPREQKLFMLTFEKRFLKELTSELEISCTLNLTVAHLFNNLL